MCKCYAYTHNRSEANLRLKTRHSWLETLGSDVCKRTNQRRLGRGRGLKETGAFFLNNNRIFLLKALLWDILLQYKQFCNRVTCYSNVSLLAVRITTQPSCEQGHMQHHIFNIQQAKYLWKAACHRLSSQAHTSNEASGAIQYRPPLDLWSICCIEYSIWNITHFIIAYNTDLVYVEPNTL